MNSGFYSPDKALAQLEWEQMTGSLWTPIFIYFFQISQDLDLVMPSKFSGGFLSLFLYKTTTLTGDGGFDWSWSLEHR